MLTKPVYLEIDKPNYVPIYTVQYDYNSRFYEITILNNSQPLDLTGIRVIVAGKKPDGKEVFNSCKVLDAKKGLIQLELTEQMNAVNGASEYALELFSADGMLSSQPFKLIVTRSTISKSVESSKELGALKDALNEVQDIDNRFAQTNAQLSEKPNKDYVWNMSNMGQDVREAMTGGSVAVVGKNSVLAENIVDGQVTVNKVNFLNKKLYQSQDGVIIGAIGDTGFNANYCVTRYIPVTNNTTLTTTPVYRVACYTPEFDFITNITSSSDGSYNLSSVRNIGYVKICYEKANKYSTVITVNGLVEEYEVDFKNPLSFQNENQIIKDLKDSNGTGFNLFDKNDKNIVSGIFDKLCRIVVDETYKISGYISVEKNNVYKTNMTSYGCYYDKYKNPLFRSVNSSTITVPDCDDICYIRVCGNVDVNKAYFVKGESSKFTDTYDLNERFVQSIDKALNKDKSDINRLVTTNNLLSKFDLVNEQLTDNGGYNQSEDYVSTPAFEVSYQDIVYFNKRCYYAQFFDSTYKYLGKLNNINSSINLSAYSTLVNVKYVRLCFTKENKDGLTISLNDANVSYALPNGFLDSQKESIKDIASQDSFRIEQLISTNNLLATCKIITFENGSQESDFVEATANDYIVVKGCYRVNFYDENKSFLNFITTNAASTLKISNYPALLNTRYVKMLFSSSSPWDNSCYLLKNEKTVKYEYQQTPYSEYTNVFNGETFNANTYRIPFMTYTRNGTLIIGSDVRYNSAKDQDLTDIGIARSTDDGVTWTDHRIAVHNDGVSEVSRAMDGTILATKQGRIYLVANHWAESTDGWLTSNEHPDPDWSCRLYHSDDDGLTWEFNQDLSVLLKEGQSAFIGGVGTGIEMSDGTLVFPIQVSLQNDDPYVWQSGIIYSLDQGATWRMSDTLLPEDSGECSVVEYPTGTIMINARKMNNCRAVYTTSDLGENWYVHPSNGFKTSPACQGHMIKIELNSTEMVIFSTPYGTSRTNNIALWVLVKDKFLLVDSHLKGGTYTLGYSCLAFNPYQRRLYCAYEVNGLSFKEITELLPFVQLNYNIGLI